MGSPLGVTFANYYMCNLENKVMKDNSLKPTICTRYVDDCFVVVRDENHLRTLKNEMERQSSLKFTYELSINKILPFLDVKVEGTEDGFSTSVFRKPTSSGSYLNAKSECPERYKDGMIHGLILRTHKISSTWSSFHQELNTLKQTLVNNGYENRRIDLVIQNFLNKQMEKQTVENNTVNTHRVFYKNQMHSNYATDESVLKKIIKNNVKCVDQKSFLKLIIYYKNIRTSSLVMKNNPQVNAPLQKTNVIYEYDCTLGDCELQKNHKYIGETVTTLSRRLTMHLASGGPYIHTKQDHKTLLTRKMLVENTKILAHITDYNRLMIRESLLIKQEKPSINNQATGVARTLQLFSNS